MVIHKVWNISLLLREYRKKITLEILPFLAHLAVFSHNMVSSSMVKKTPRNILQYTRVSLMVIGDLLC